MSPYRQPARLTRALSPPRPAARDAPPLPVVTTGPEPRPLARVLWAFLLVGLISFGGGRTAYFQDVLVLRRRWFTNEEFLEAIAISQVLPGPTMGNLAAYLGQRLHGWLGAVVAVTCLTVPGGLMILGLAWVYFHGMPAALATPVGRGVSAASLGLAVASVLRLRGGAGGAAGYAIAALTFVLFGPLGWPIHFVLLAGLPPALVVAWWARR